MTNTINKLTDSIGAISLNAEFKSLTRNKAGEAMVFHILHTDLRNAAPLLEFVDKEVFVSITGREFTEYPVHAELKSVTSDAKKIAIKLVLIEGDKDKVISIYPYAGKTIDVIIAKTQPEIEDFLNALDAEQDEA